MAGVLSEPASAGDGEVAHVEGTGAVPASAGEGATILIECERWSAPTGRCPGGLSEKERTAEDARASEVAVEMSEPIGGDRCLPPVRMKAGSGVSDKALAVKPR